MPPKKKGKKSKAEQEAEKLAAEAEAARLEKEAEERRIAEEKAAEEARQRKIEEQKQFRQDELDRLAASFEEMLPIVSARAESLAMHKQKFAEAEEWDRYMSCVTKFASNEADLNTYLSETKAITNMNLQEAMDCFTYTETIVNDLFSSVSKMMSSFDFDADKVEVMRGFMPLLREMCVTKLDEATLDIIQHSDHYFVSTADGKGKEIKLGKKSGDIKMGMWVFHQKKSFKYYPLIFDNLDMRIDIPRPFASAQVAVRAIHFPYRQISSRFGTENLVLGGIFQLDIIHLPPTAKKVTGWVMRQVTEKSTKIHKSNYPIGNPDGVISAVAPQIKCSLKLGSGLILPEDPKVAWFHPVEHRWVTDAVTDADYNPDTGTLKFHVVAVGSFAVVQDALTDLCFKQWSVTPVMARGDEEQEIHYTLQTPRFTVKIAAKSGGKCQLLEPQIEPLKELREKLLEPAQLLNELRVAGINIMPTDENASKAKLHNSDAPGLTLKTPEIEKKACFVVSHLCTSFDFMSSRWNNSIGKGRCTFQVKETDAFTGGSDLVDYSVGMVELDKESQTAIDAPEVGEVVDGIKCSLILGGEEPSSRAFNPQIVSGTETQLYMSKCVKHICTPESLARVEASNGQINDTVKSL
eukprot:CAMPEP_0118659370 /NCGR_PEP_ID=MMETSP0785-20121206/15073_1 /TAXON_ID=91992 /ORGANISM="Bolidomonas pacifica, Strain CCMP 1866" /LENGTH=635 /DNA_ID=CAMNT_0006552465 /DNA_START=32 /DNA_END=1936 /DNA_ORIENTATION=-